jgi:hypothetical protein
MEVLVLTFITGLLIGQWITFLMIYRAIVKLVSMLVYGREHDMYPRIIRYLPEESLDHRQER